MTDTGIPVPEGPTELIDTDYTIGQDVGLTGTPAIVLSNGTLFSGYMPAERLKQAIVASGI